MNRVSSPPAETEVKPAVPPVRIEPQDALHWQGLCALHELFFGVKRDQRFWEWKYRQRPDCADCTVVAVAGDAVVGQFGMPNYRARIAGTPAMIYQGQDILILEPYRRVGRRRLFTDMDKAYRSRLRKDHAALSYAFSIELTRKLFTRLLGYTDLGRIPKLVQIWNVEPYLRQKIRWRWLSWVASVLLNPLLRLRNKRAKVSLPPGCRLERVVEFDQRFDRLWERCQDGYPLSIVRDARYLTWRYQTNPVQSTDTAAVVDDRGEVTGFIVTEIKEGVRKFSTLEVEVNAARRGEILDCWAAPGPQHDQVLGSLIGAAQQQFIERRVEVVSCWALPHMRLYGLLEQLGFAIRQTPHNLVVRIENPQLAGVDLAMDLRNWCVSRGDVDHF